jgi:mxaJ protein
MYSSFLKLTVAMAVLFCAAVLAAQTSVTICADPQNPPFSTRQKTGFENKIASAIGAELHQPVRFHWVRMGRGFVREVVNKGQCDALIAVPVGMRGLLITAPYYRSTYVFVTRSADQPIASLDDPRLRHLKIGVQVLDDDYAPPARALARRQLTKNVVGFEMDESAGAIIDAVAKKKVDASIVWGPLAGYYARQYGKKLRLQPVTPEFDPPQLPFTFEIAAGVRKSEPELLSRLNSAIRRAQPTIDRILHAYGVPLMPLTQRSAERNGQ